MKIEANTVEEYLNNIPEERKEIITQIRDMVNENLPKDFEEQLNYGMIGWVVPHSVYPSGYHCNPKQPLPFMNLASQKNHIGFYHMGMYANPDLLEWFEKKYAREAPTKLNMGKSCVRFKKPEHVPLDLLGELVAKMSADDWITLYEKNVKR